ncbi:hypothetical protein GQR58_030164 [Nymphon striatum]|nr:hypothetical protein GQR58_030164 [Nymphon striatum]
MSKPHSVSRSETKRPDLLRDETGMVNQFAGSVPTLDQLDPQVAEAVRRFDDVHRALGIATTTSRYSRSMRQRRASSRACTTTPPHDPDSGRPGAFGRRPVDCAAIGARPRGRPRMAGTQRNPRAGALATDQLVGGALIEGEADWVAGQWLASSRARCPRRWVGRLEAHRAAEPIADGAIVTACDPGAGFVPEPVVAPDQPSPSLQGARCRITTSAHQTGSLPRLVWRRSSPGAGARSESGRTAPEPDWVQIPEIAALTTAPDKPQSLTCQLYRVSGSPDACAKRSAPAQ